ncbi:MAG: hypothetical protein ACRETD_11655, partial [Steroidobacteraceae bacterium]
ISQMVGAVAAAAFAAIVAFAVLPGLETFEAFSLAIGLYLVPVGALMAQPWQTALLPPWRPVSCRCSRQRT